MSRDGTRQPGPVFDFHARDVGTLGFHAALKESGKNQYLEDVPDLPAQVTIDEPTFRALLAEKAAIAQNLVLRAAPIIMAALSRISQPIERPEAILPDNTPEELRKRFDRALWSDGVMYARAHLLENGFPAVIPLLSDERHGAVKWSEPGTKPGPFHHCPFCGAKAP